MIRENNRFSEPNYYDFKKTTTRECFFLRCLNVRDFFPINHIMHFTLRSTLSTNGFCSSTSLKNFASSYRKTDKITGVITTRTGINGHGNLSFLFYFSKQSLVENINGKLKKTVVKIKSWGITLISVDKVKGIDHKRQHQMSIWEDNTGKLRNIPFIDNQDILFLWYL